MEKTYEKIVREWTYDEAEESLVITTPFSLPL